MILGRGSAQSWRPGNVNFHDILDQKPPRYQASPTKKGKRQIIQEIYDLITHQNGRFLEKAGDDSDQYVEVDEDTALASIGYGMRYRKKRILKAEAELAKQIEEAKANEQDNEGATTARETPN